MGAQIAAHFANAGVPALLLDLTADVAREGLERARDAEAGSVLHAGSCATHHASAASTRTSHASPTPTGSSRPWSNGSTSKRALLARVDAVRRPGAIVSSNTSGIPIASLAEGRSDEFRRHWLGTHFFNPPRYLRLLEIIPTAETDPAVVDRRRAFADHRLGKGVVVAKDTPNFIANHVGLARRRAGCFARSSRASYTIEEIDAITGPALGRPKSATFRTMDIAGLDVLAHVVRNLHDRLPDDVTATRFGLPPLARRHARRAGWLGEKAGAASTGARGTPAASPRSSRSIRQR